MRNLFSQSPATIAFANSVDAFIPEVWAQEALMVLENNMVMGNLVHRDFENEIAQFGDVVNTRRPSKFSMSRKGVNDDVVEEDAVATNVAVPLNQHLYKSFIIKDGEESKGMTSLVNTYLTPAVISIAEGIDQILHMQTYRFLPNAVGAIGTTTAVSTVIDAREKLTTNLCPMSGRSLILTPTQEGHLLNIDAFTGAEKTGDAGTAIREGSLGRKLGFDCFTAQQAPSISSNVTTVTGAVNNAGGYAIGTTSLTVDGFSAAITNGSWIKLDGQPYKVVSTVGGATPTSITIQSGLRKATADDAVVTVVRPALVNLGAGYANGWEKGIVYDTITPIRSGQLVSTGVGALVYGALAGTSATSVLLDRPIEAALADDAVLGLGPAGQYGLAFHRNALALVTRPLAAPRPGTGALSAVANYNGLGIRVVIAYDSVKQGHRVTVDLLAGVQVLYDELGVPVLA